MGESETLPPSNISIVVVRTCVRVVCLSKHLFEIASYLVDDILSGAIVYLRLLS